MKTKYFVDLTGPDRHFKMGEEELTFHKIGKPSKLVSNLKLQAASILAESICQNMEHIRIANDAEGIGHTLFFVPDSVIALSIVNKVISDTSIPSFVILIDPGTDAGELLDVSYFFMKGDDEKEVEAKDLK